MSIEINEPWQSESDAKLAAMEVALNLASEERDAARTSVIAIAHELDAARQCNDAWQSKLAALTREVDRLTQDRKPLVANRDALDKENQRLQEELSSLHTTVSRNWQLELEEDNADLKAQLQSAHAALRAAKALIEEWLPTHTPMPPSKEETVLAQIDATLEGKEIPTPAKPC